MVSSESPESPLEQPLTGHRAGFYSVPRGLQSPRPGHSMELSLPGPRGEQKVQWRAESCGDNWLGSCSFTSSFPSSFSPGLDTGLFYDVQTIMSALSLGAPGEILVMSLAALESQGFSPAKQNECILTTNNHNLKLQFRVMSDEILHGI